MFPPNGSCRALPPGYSMLIQIQAIAEILFDLKMKELSKEDETKIRKELQDRKKLILKEMQDTYPGTFKERKQLIKPGLASGFDFGC